MPRCVSKQITIFSRKLFCFPGRVDGECVNHRYDTESANFMSYEAIAYAPVVLLGMAESSSGELDLILAQRSSSAFSRMNYTQFSTVLGDLAPFSSPRFSNWNLPVWAAKDCFGFTPTSPMLNSFIYDKNCTGNACTASICAPPMFSNLFLIDFKRERDIQIGRSWNLPDLAAGETHIQRTFALNLGVQIGDVLFIGIPLNGMAPFSYDAAVAASNGYDLAKFVYTPVLIKGIFSYPMGKFSQLVDNPILLEWNTFLATILHALPPSTPPTFLSRMQFAIDHQELDQQAGQIVFSCAKNRVSCYLSSDFPSILNSIVQWASDIAYRTAFFEVQTDLPVVAQLSHVQLFSRFLNLLFSLVILLLTSLSTFLIYSLLMVSVEAKTFEMGIFRMIGMPRSGLVLMLLVWSFGAC